LRRFALIYGQDAASSFPALKIRGAIALEVFPKSGENLKVLPLHKSMREKLRPATHVT